VKLVQMLPRLQLAFTNRELPRLGQGVIVSIDGTLGIIEPDSNSPRVEWLSGEGANSIDECTSIDEVPEAEGSGAFEEDFGKGSAVSVDGTNCRQGVVEWWKDGKEWWNDFLSGGKMDSMEWLRNSRDGYRILRNLEEYLRNDESHRYVGIKGDDGDMLVIKVRSVR